MGDIIQVKCDQDVPCDMVVLRSSEEEGACHITTVNLDGETNIKVCVKKHVWTCACV